MFKKSVVAGVLGFASLFGAAQASTIAGNFDANGLSVFSFTLTSASQVDFLATGGYSDPTISLFNSAGAHLISNDDSVSLMYHLTQDLAAGSYSVMISYCCNAYSFAGTNGATSASTDGFNTGSYMTGGSATLATISAFMGTQGGYGAQQAYALNMTSTPPVNDTPVQGGNAVPEPASLALTGLALLGMVATRRRAV